MARLGTGARRARYAVAGTSTRSLVGARRGRMPASDASAAAAAASCAATGIVATIGVGVVRTAGS